MTSPRWRRYLRFWGNNVGGDVDDEFRFHLEAEIEALVDRGMSHDDAAGEALRRFGDVDYYRRYCRSADAHRLGRERRRETFDMLAQDLRYAVRSLRRQPAFTLIAVLTLALGIGASTAIFSVVNGVLLKPLPYREPDRLVMLWESMKDADRIMVSYPDFLDWRQRQRGFEDIAVYSPFHAFNMTGQGDAERVRGAIVSGNYFEVLGLRAGIGRLIAPRDDSPAAERVAVLSDGYFQSRFGGSRSITSKTLMLDGAAYTVVGVLPPGIRIADCDIFVPVGPFSRTPIYTRENHPGLIGVGRLKPGVTVAQAIEDLQRVSAELRAEYPKEAAGISAGGAPMKDIIVGQIKPALRVLMIAVGFVLLIACANVASLLLSRAISRQREFAVRTALGASRGRLARQLLVESLVLSLAGGALGVALATGGVKLLVALNPSSVPRLADITVDSTVLLFALSISLLPGLLFGLIPAVQPGHRNLVNGLKDGARGASAGVSPQRARAMLTVAEMALAVMLLAAAALLGRSFAKLMAVDIGFEPTHLLASLVQLPEAKYATPEQSRVAFDQLLERVRAIPGVESAAVGTDQPLGSNWQTGVSFAGLPPFAPGQAPLLNAAVVDPSYFETVGIPLVAGRRFAATDGPTAPLVVVISASIAKKFFANMNPIGQRMKQGLPGGAAPWRTIVGVVRDTRTDGLTQQPRGIFYLPRAQEEMRRGLLLVRSSAPTERLTGELRRALADVDKDVPLASTQTMDAVLAEYLESPKLSMLLLAGFAVVALVLASVGLYGVISYNVTQRSSEIGVRIALGARMRHVMRLVVTQAMTLAAIGVALGMLLTLWTAKSLSSMLFGVSPRDPLVLVAVSGFLLLVAFVAAMAPAMRAARIDPAEAIRAE